jgi:hypothetical protein
MSYAGQMLGTYPRDFNVEARVLATSIDALIECAQACRRCEQACRELLAAMK